MLNLYIEGVQKYNEAADQLIWNRIHEGATVREGVLKVLLSAAEVLPGGNGIPSGCMVNLATLGDECPGGVPEAVRTARFGGQAALKRGIQRAVDAGELKRSTDVERLSRFYMGVVQGMAVQAYDGASRTDLAETAEVAMDAWPSA